MRHSILLLALLLWPTAVAAQSAGFRVTSDVVGSDIVVDGPDVARSGRAPLLLEELPPGFYRVRVFREGRPLSEAKLRFDSRLHLTNSRGSRSVLSAMVPGLGQWRDFGVVEGIAPLAAVGGAAGRGLVFHNNRGQAQEELDAWGAVGAQDRFTPVDDDDDPGTPDVLVPMTQLAYDKRTADLQDRIWLEEQTRNDYLFLAGALHLGNILTANVRRGDYRIDLSSSNSLAARYQPPPRAAVVGLSALWPGLGQTRAGHSWRGLFWNFTALAAGTTLVEVLRDRDLDQVTVWTMERQIFLETEEAGAASASTLAAHEKAVRALESAENARNAVLLGMGALWALNLADAFFVGAVEPVERWDLASRRIQTDLAWVGDGPGVRFLMRF